MNDMANHLSYFPGCSLATTAKENNASLKSFLNHFDIELTEINDWNCCGSSSTHSINSQLALSLAVRNLFLAPPDRQLLIACPGCFLRLSHAKMELNASREKQTQYEAHFDSPYNANLELVHFFELLVKMSGKGLFKNLTGRLNGLKIAPYYGCMLARPPRMNKEKNHYGLIEKTMSTLGGESIQWPFLSSCCGTFLSVSKPMIAEKLVNRIMNGAIRSGAECIVTACAMCHLNLEIRCRPENRLPIFHFSEVLSLALEGEASKDWFKRHLINPESLLEQRQLGQAQMIQNFKEKANKMTIPGNLMTTAMAVMPHTNVDQAFQTALSLDIPFWPQLPNYSYYEDMYVQAAEHFPGILLDMENKTLRFSMDKFIEEFEETMSHFEDPDYFDISSTYSSVYHKFLDIDLTDRPAIRGQLEGPVSFGFNILDQDDRPILFDDTIRPFMFEIMAKRINVQLRRLKEKNTNAFMFIDEPGMQFIFSAMSGYGEQKAKEDLDLFFSTIDSPKGIHLCGNPDWDFLLVMDMDVLSFDVYTNAQIFSSCTRSIKSFLDRDGILVWGIVPTGIETFEKENLDLLAFKLKTIWKTLTQKGVPLEQILNQSLISPATCCLVNQDKEKTVEKAFQLTQKLSENLREQYRLI